MPWLSTAYLKTISLKHELKRLEHLLLPKFNDPIADLLLTTRPDLTREEMREIIKKEVTKAIALEYERHVEYYSFVGVSQKWLTAHFIKYFNTGW